MFSIVKQVLPRVIKNTQVSPSFRKLSTIAEQTIHITFVDREGNRATVPGRIGTTLLQVAELHNIDLEGPCEGGGGPQYIRRTENWVEHVYGEGPTCGFCHVQISSAFDHLLDEKFENETDLIERHWLHEAVKTSRLACLIKLQKKHDGLVVFVPDAQPVDVI